MYFKESKDTKLIYLHCLQCRHFIKISRFDCQENGHSDKIYTWPHHRYYLPLSSCGAQSTCSHLSLRCVGGKDVQKYRYLLLLYRNQQWVAISITFNKIWFDMLWAGNSFDNQSQSTLCGTSYSVRFLHVCLLVQHFIVYSFYRSLIKTFCKCLENFGLTSNISSGLHSGENLASFVLMSEILISSQPQQKCWKIWVCFRVLGNLILLTVSDFFCKISGNSVSCDREKNKE